MQEAASTGEKLGFFIALITTILFIATLGEREHKRNRCKYIQWSVPAVLFNTLSGVIIAELVMTFGVPGLIRPFLPTSCEERVQAFGQGEENWPCRVEKKGLLWLVYRLLRPVVLTAIVTVPITRWIVLRDIREKIRREKIEERRKLAERIGEEVLRAQEERREVEEARQEEWSVGNL